MGNCNGTLSVHEGMGTAQNDRIAEALQPDFFLLDERSEQDFIRFVQKLSTQVQFYNQFDSAEGNWAEFFAKESTAILIAVTGWNVELMQQGFEKEKLTILTYNDLDVQKAALAAYFQKIQDQFNHLLGKTKLLDGEISQKENLVSTAYLITERLQYLLEHKIDGITDTEAFLKSPEFGRLFQQLLGLLLSWKNFSQNAIEHQLNNYAAHAPHFTLFLTFLKLLQLAKESFNGFTKKHLDFYYKEVLRMQNQKAKPDFVHLIVEPFNVKPFLIAKGTVFPAGKNTEGQEKFYASTADQTVNGIKLASLVSDHLGSQRYKTDALEYNDKGPGFDIFTADKKSYKEALFLASPLLYLQSGNRTIQLRINDTDYEEKDFEFYLSGEEKVLHLTSKKVKTIDGKKFIALMIPAKEKKIIPFDAKLHPEFLVETRFPVLKIVPNKSISNIAHINLKIEVNHFKSYVLDSDFGNIDPEKPFYPFGEFPKNGNGLTVHSNEFFMKKDAVATFAIPATSEKSENWMVKKVKILRLNNGQWKDFAAYLSPVSNVYPLAGYNFNQVATIDGQPNGSFRIVLENDSYKGETFLQDYIAQSSRPSPTLPYKPRANTFVFNYSVSETINLANPKTANRIDLYHALPFGYSKLDKNILRFTTTPSQQGHVYLGFEKAMPKDGLSFLIQLEEGTANPQMQPATVSWDYLSHNRWIPVETSALGDETVSLTRSGLVNLTVPDFNPANTKLPAGLFWLRLSVSNVKAISRFLGIHVQALKAVLTDYRNSGGEFLENTPKETISKSDKTIDGVKKFRQPYASFDGRKTEEDTFLYRRTSERLRHKNRAITSWDYEHMILEAFPEVYRVKTLNHYRYDHTISNASAGFVTLIPVAKSSKAEKINWRPLLSLDKMVRIKEYLSQIASPHARINVKPPKPELVRIHFKVKYHEQPGMDKRLFTLKLIDLINAYLSPWAYEADEINFANEIEFSSIIQLIDSQPYVDYLTDFKVQQFLLDENNQITGSAIQNLERIAPQTDFTLFVPDESHRIEEL